MTSSGAGRAAVVAIVLGLATAACGGDEVDVDPESETERAAVDGDGAAGPTSGDERASSADEGSGSESAEPIPDGPKATLTGLPADEGLAERPAVVVKISNNDDRSLEALIGIDAADIVIEERIEDRATRFAAIFHSELPAEVGPVRSARTTDLDLLRNLGTPILVFSGANVSVLRELRDLALDEDVVLVVNDDSGTYHYRDSDYSAPDNLFSDAMLVAEDFAETAGEAAPIVVFRGSDTDTRPASVDGSGFTVAGRDLVSFVHVDGVGYVRVQDGEVHRTREGTELAATNVVVMETAYVPNANDQASIDAITVGEGPVSVLIGGRRWDGVWSRPQAGDAYRFRADSGAEVLLEPGRTWITLVPAGTYEFAVDAEIADLARLASR